MYINNTAIGSRKLKQSKVLYQYLDGMCTFMYVHTYVCVLHLRHPVQHINCHVLLEVQEDLGLPAPHCFAPILYVRRARPSKQMNMFW